MPGEQVAHLLRTWNGRQAQLYIGNSCLRRYVRFVGRRSDQMRIHRATSSVEL
jgi:2-succinyl-5-enolpyruvyl-6-hydroxy-3-cyclohexene-1-carboxylate synthase